MRTSAWLGSLCCNEQRLRRRDVRRWEGVVEDEEGDEDEEDEGEREGWWRGGGDGGRWDGAGQGRKR